MIETQIMDTIGPDWKAALKSEPTLWATHWRYIEAMLWGAWCWHNAGPLRDDDALSDLSLLRRVAAIHAGGAASR
jgi:hypothetical protein